MIKVFVNGTFDLLHPGHIELLNTAKKFGDHLLVAIDSDKRVKELKGDDRPINDQDTRKIMMEALKPVDECAIFNSKKELIDIIKNYKPNIMVVGSDYEFKEVVGSEFAQTLIFYKRNPIYSSTKIIEKILK